MAWPLLQENQFTPFLFLSYHSPSSFSLCLFLSPSLSLPLSISFLCHLPPSALVMAMDFSAEADDEGDTNAFKLFGSSIPFFGYGLDPERSSRKDDAASMAGICHKSPVCVLDGGKVSKDGLQNEEEDGKEEEESLKEATISTNNNGDRELQEEPACPPSLSSPSPLPTQGEEEGEANENEKREKKKPEKLLPCPRCDSLTTKFCYFNNGNVRQPRHFCKRCQRYWTAGGALRNLPVGSGRRKSKNSSSSYPPTPTPPPPPPGYLNLTEGFVASDAVDPLSASGTTPESTFPARNQKEIATHFCRNQPTNGRIEQNASGQQQYSWAANSLISNGSCETCGSNEMAFSSSQSFPLKDAQACGTTKEASKQPYSAEGLMMGRSPFSYPMGPGAYYGYGLFGWNNGGGFTATPWLGQPGLPWGLPWSFMPFPLWPPCGWGAQPSNIPPPWGHVTQSMASTSGTYGADNPIWGNRPGEGLLPTNNPFLGKHPTEGLATSNPLLGKHPREGLLPTNNPFLGNYPMGGLPTDNPIWGKHHPREGLRTDNPILGIHPGEGLFPTENPIFGKHPIEGLSTVNPFLGKHPREGLWPTDSPIFGKHPTEGLLLTDNPIWGKHHPREGLPTDNRVLGKHPREGLPTDNPILSKQPREGLLLPTYAVSNGCLLTPKTLRLRDPQEAAQSSIWSSLGLDKS